ncbi:MAG: signal transduction histidine kinase [Ilumatobacteraceae bacterium]|nr:signal transduction histidine kinase [Ilumatobacteraceae bacterium]
MAFVWLLGGLIVGAGIATLLSRRAVHRARPVGIPPADEALQRENSDLVMRVARIQSALDALPIGVIVVDSDARMVVRNTASDSSGGDAHNEVLVQAAVQHHLRAAVRGEHRSQTVELYGPPRRVVIVHANPVANGAVATIEDVTERSRLDAVRTDFVANISHELKTPIGALAVLAETLIDESDPAVISRLANKTVNEAHRVAKIIDDLLELSRIELAGDLVIATCNVAALVAEAASRNSYAAAQRRVEVRVCDVSADLTINADQGQLASALGNLVDNAVKYSDVGGKVTVAAFPEGSGVTFVVADSGIGIPTHDLDRIFERFYRVDRARSRGTGGTGLGLSIVRHVTGNHGGDVTVESREGEGSTFRLHIPDRPVPAA